MKKKGEMKGAKKNKQKKGENKIKKLKHKKR
jgi:hypothetical protein